MPMSNRVIGLESSWRQQGILGSPHGTKMIGAAKIAKNRMRSGRPHAPGFRVHLFRAHVGLTNKMVICGVGCKTISEQC